jgi:hypothetical protein
LRRAIEFATRQGEQVPAGPDYSPTLGKMEMALQTIAKRLEAVERQPVLTLTPARFRAEMDAVAQSAVSFVSRPLGDIALETRIAVDDLKAIVGHTRTRREQQKSLAAAGVIGIMGGVFLWFMLIAMLPSPAGDWLATLPLGGGPWEVGTALMQRASPQSFNKMARLYKVCGEEETEFCEAAMAVRTLEPVQEPKKAPPTVKKSQ